MAKSKKKIQSAVSIVKTEKAEIPKTKVGKAFALYKKLKLEGIKPKAIFQTIAEELKISERVARGYVWRAKNPEKFKMLLERYFEKRKAKAKPKAETEAK